MSIPNKLQGCIITIERRLNKANLKNERRENEFSWRVCKLSYKTNVNPERGNYLRTRTMLNRVGLVEKASYELLWVRTPFAIGNFLKGWVIKVINGPANYCV